MLIASMIAKVRPAGAEEVARQLGRIPGLTIYGVHKQENVVIVAEARDEQQLENIARHILETFEDVVGVYPTFMAAEESVPEGTPWTAA